MLFGRTGRPRSRGRVSGDKGEHPRRSRFDSPAECRYTKTRLDCARRFCIARNAALYLLPLCRCVSVPAPVWE
jgi:hypothetical protein